METVTYKKVVQAMQKMKSGKKSELSELSVEMIVACGEIGVKVMKTAHTESWKNA